MNLPGSRSGEEAGLTEVPGASIAQESRFECPIRMLRVVFGGSLRVPSNWLLNRVRFSRLVS